MINFLSKKAAISYWGLIFLVFTAASPALAQTSLPALQAQVQELLKANKKAEALALLTNLQLDQEHNPDFDYLLGTTALEADAPQLAINALERVVMMRPNFAGAWLDLAIAYFRSGDPEMAAQIIKHVDDNFSPPEKLKAELTEVRRKIKSSQTGDGWRFNAGLLSGHVKNANYGLSQSTFQLTPVGGTPIDVAVDVDSKPRSDNALEMRAEVYRRFNYEDKTRSDLQLSVRAREYSQVTNQNFIDLAAYWAYTRPFFGINDWEVQSGATVRHMILDNKSLATNASVFAGLITRVKQCESNARMEFEYRASAGSARFDANIPWLGFGMSCPFGKVIVDANHRYGWDNPSGDRPGGLTRRQESSIQARWFASERFQARGIFYYANYQDQVGYSELLSYGAKRTIDRVGKRLELAWVLPIARSNHWVMQLELDDVKNDSNIAVSKFNDTQVFLGLRYQLF